MNRRRFLKMVGVTGAGYSLAAGAGLSCSRYSGKPVNFILITADDLNYDSVGCYGCTVPDITPNIDKLFSTSYKFINAISVGCDTRTSFPAIFTSVNPFMLLLLKEEGYMNIPSNIKTITDSGATAAFPTGTTIEEVIVFINQLENN